MFIFENNLLSLIFLYERAGQNIGNCVSILDSKEFNSVLKRQQFWERFHQGLGNKWIYFLPWYWA